MKPKDIKRIERVVLISAIVLILIGIVEILVGKHSGSLGLVADGIDSMSDSVISFMVWMGLKISKRGADKRFNFGYFRIETLVSMIVAILMFIMSLTIAYQAYQRLIDPTELHYPFIAMVTLAIGGFISLYISVIKNRLAKKYNLLSLNADAKTAMKDWTSSFIILLGVFLSFLGFKWGDAIGAMIVAGYIAFVGISTIKQASLILIDGFNNPELVRDIARIIKKYPQVRLKELKLRMSGPYILGEVFVAVDSSMTLGEAHIIKGKIQGSINKKIEGIQDLVIIAEPQKR
jgi:cation diffusion facilitator family transporter